MLSSKPLARRALLAEVVPDGLGQVRDRPLPASRLLRFLDISFRSAPSGYPHVMTALFPIESIPDPEPPPDGPDPLPEPPPDPGTPYPAPDPGTPYPVPDPR